MGNDWATLLKPAVRRILDEMLRGSTTLTEIARATGMTKSAILPHLKSLVAIGAVSHERVPTSTGSEARYRLRDLSLHLSIRASGPTAIAWAAPGAWSPDLPLLPQVPQPEVREEVAKLLRSLGNDLRGIDELVLILFGSGARGDATWKSDIDLLVLLPERDAEKEREFADATYETQITTQHPFSVTFLARAEWPTSRKRIVEEAREEGMIVWAPRGENAPWSTMKRYRAITL